jgi:hypothetical protein
MSVIEQFITQKTELGSEFNILCKTLADKYVEFNDGNTTGKMKLYAYLKSLNGVSKTRTHFIGIRMIESVVQPIVEPTPVVQVNADINYKLEKLRLMEKLAKETAEREEKLAKETAEREEKLAKETAERKERLLQMKLQSEEKLRMMEVEMHKTLGAKKIETKVQITEMTIKKDMDIIHIKMEDNDKHRKWMEHENNKNRLMTSAVRYNQYLDARVYGTPSQQYIAIDSLKDTLDFRTFMVTREVNSNMINDAINSNIDLIEKIEVKENNTTKKIDVIRTENVPEIIKVIADNHDNKVKINYVMEPLGSKLMEFKHETCHGDKRVLPTMYEDQINSNDKNTKKSLSDKVQLAERSKLCDLSKKNDKYHVNCFCCNTAIPLLDAMCQRGHNLPKSKGGSFADFNVELICANCNISMGDYKTVYEYLASIYDVKRQADEPVSEEE